MSTKVSIRKVLEIVNEFTVAKPLALLPLLTLSFASCDGPEQSPETYGLAAVPLEGTWQYDSTNATIYSFHKEFLNHFTPSLPAGAILTIGASQWRYSGSIREEHSYTRRGSTLVVRRLVDSTVVRAGYTTWEDLGKLTPYADTLIITTLTPHRLVTKDSTQDPNGSIYRVWYGYYSR